MKKSIKSTSSLVMVILVVVSLTLVAFKKGDCDDEVLMDDALSRLKNYTLIQNFPFYMKEKKKKEQVQLKKQLITLNRGVRYKFFTVRNESFEGIPILSIYNNEKMEFLIAITYNASLKKFYNELEFECKATGNYCLAFSFQDGLEGCALGVFSSLINK